jgi:hypothetical protein
MLDNALAQSAVLGSVYILLFAINEYFSSYTVVCCSLLLKLHTPAQRENNANILSVAPAPPHSGLQWMEQR